MKRLIIHGDDFGLTKATNKGIIKAFKEGVLNSTSLLANFPAFEDAVQAAKENPNLDTGIHFNLLDGRPVSPCSQISTLINKDGYFIYSPHLFFLKILTKRASLKEIEIELRSQIEKILRTGLRISHFDGHKHIHMFPPIFKILLKLSKEYGIKAMRFPCEKGHFRLEYVNRKYIIRHSVRWILRYASNSLRNLISKHEIICPDNFIGIIDVGNLGLRKLKRIIESLPYGTTEIMVHPAFNSQELKSLGYRWIKYHKFEDELQALVNPEIKNLIKSQNVDLISYRDLIAYVE